MIDRNAAWQIRFATDCDHNAAERFTELCFQTIRSVYRPIDAKPNQISPNEKRGDPLESPYDTPPRSKATLIAQSDDYWLGTVRLCVQSRQLHLLGLCVHPEHRRRGIATDLIKHAAAYALDHELPRLSLFTIAETGNCDLFQRIGFRVVAQGRRAL